MSGPRPGQQVVLVDPSDFEVEAILDFDEQHHVWVGTPDWSTRREVSQWLPVEQPSGEDVVPVLDKVLEILSTSTVRLECYLTRES